METESRLADVNFVLTKSLGHLELQSIYWTNTVTLLFVILFAPVKNQIFMNYSHVLDITKSQMHSCLLLNIMLTERFKILLACFGFVHCVVVSVVKCILSEIRSVIRNSEWELLCSLLTAPFHPSWIVLLGFNLVLWHLVAHTKKIPSVLAQNIVAHENNLSFFHPQPALCAALMNPANMEHFP